jgi:tetratricopeptide (TPR) repeat protein
MKATVSHRYPLPQLRRWLAWLALVVAALLALALAAGLMRPAHADETPQRLTSQPRAATKAPASAVVGDTIETNAGQRRRLALPDGGILFVNENTRIKLDAARRLTLAAGEVYVEGTAVEPLVIKTPKREVRGKQASFAVRAAEQGTGVLVTRGQAHVSGLDRPLHAGQRLAPEGGRPAAAPRASLLLDWTRALKTAAESPLVPASQHAGGALIAHDPNGQEAKLSLRKFHVDVFIEDGFARTTIDQTYFNSDPWQMEGTFYFPLPPDASLSRLAMYVDGQLMEGGMVERDYARQVYETIRYARRDPALLEWVDGSTFKMRVFPLEPRQEKRLLLSYTQKLPSLYGQLQYRFPAGHSLEKVRDWSFHARIKGGAAAGWGSTSHTLRAGKDGADLVLDATEKNARPDRDVVLTVADPAFEGAARFATAELEGARYLMVRLRPDRLQLAPDEERLARGRGPRTWLFLFESSGDRDPLLARVQIEVIRGLLAQADADDTFAVLAAGTRVRALAKEPLPVTAENVQAALTFLEGSHLIGALDLGHALAEAEPMLKGAKNGYLVHVGSGIAAMGERREDVLARRIPEGTRYVGVGVGRRWARSFMKAAAERSGGYFTQVNPDEPVSWRAFELASTLRTLAAGAGGAEISLPGGKGADATQPGFLYVSRSLAPGEELCALTRLPARAELPREVSVVLGDGQAVAVPVRDVAEGAGYLPRTWARLEIERLLAEEAAKHKEAIIALSKAMYVMTPYTSLLVLENEDLYTQYKVDRGRKDHWAMYPAPNKIPVVYEPDPDQPDPKAKAGQRLPARQVVKTLVVREPLRVMAGYADVTNADRELVRTEATRARAIPMSARVVARPAQRVFVPTKMPARLTPLSEDRPPGDRLLSATPVADLAVPAGQDPPALETFGRPARPTTPPGATAPGLDFGYLPSGGPAAGFHLQIRGNLNKASKADLAVLGTDFGEPLLASGRLGPVGLTPAGTFTPDLRLSIQSFKRLADKDADFIGFSGAPREKEVPASAHAAYLYQRPSYSGQDRLFYDLVAYCPGLNTSAADIEAVLEAEAFPDPHSKRGQIDEAARVLIDKSRPAGWQALTLTGEDSQAGVTILFDGSGCYAWQRTLPPGIRERVVCDGKTLLHLYPQLGLAARRSVSRFHREDFADLVPWVVPPAEDLARGADLKRMDERTVAIIPHGAADARDKKGQPVPYLRLHLLFAEDGRLAERQVVRMPKKEILLRQTCAGDGTVRLLGKDGKELHVRRGKLSEPIAPDLAPDTKDLVVLSLPYRTRAHVLKTRKIEGVQYPNLRFADALPLLAADVASGNGGEAANVFRQAFHAREQRQLGLYVLLAACGQSLDAQGLDVLGEHPDVPLAQYLALHSSPVLRKHASQWAVQSAAWGEPLLQHLALTHALLQRWSDERITKGSPARVQTERARALEYVRKHKDSAFAWALLGLMQDRAGKDAAFHGELADAFLLFQDRPGLAYAARYENARSLLRAGRRPVARQAFRALYERTLKEDVLPPVDGDFRLALLGGDTGSDGWTELLRRTAEQLVQRKHRPAALALARQCWQLSDPALANQLVAVALEGVREDKERLPLTLAAVAFFQESAQLPQADELLQTLLTDAKQARRPELWRLAADIAAKRDMTGRSLECLERALDAEYGKLPEVIDLQTARQEYGKLLEHYQNLADAMVTLRVRPPEGFLAKVVRTADRWRALDREQASACQTAARILRTLADRELGWDYLTTPVGLKPNEAEPWLGLAQSLRRTGDLDLAERAYRAACEAEPTNADYLWDRAQNLRQAGKGPEARQLFRRIAEGRWQPRFQPTQARAKAQLAES